jgi:hypothetical protein
MLRNAPVARKFVKKNPQVFMADVCNYHNAQTKCADLPEARTLLLQNKVELYGMDYMVGMWNDLAECFKQFPVEWALHRLLK